MRRTILMSMTLALGLALVLPGLAFARGVVSNNYENLDWKIDRAYDDGWLTRWELDELRAMQVQADRVIDRAFRDGRVTGREQVKIDVETDAVVVTFRLYRDNQSMRYARPVVIVTPVPARPRVVVYHGPGYHGHHKYSKPHKPRGKSHRR